MIEYFHSLSYVDFWKLTTLKDWLIHRSLVIELQCLWFWIICICLHLYTYKCKSWFYFLFFYLNIFFANMLHYWLVL